MTRDLLYLDDLQVIVYYHQRSAYYASPEEGPGVEHFIETTLEQADIEVFGSTVDILPCLSDKQKERIVRTINKEKV